MERETKVEETIEEKEARPGVTKRVKRKIESDRDLLEPKKMEVRKTEETTEREI
jgi:hypothetical protein